MHDTAHLHGRLFFEFYISDATRVVVDLGSQDVNGTLRDHCPAGVHYIGLDVMQAKGVDLVIDPSAALPLAPNSVDAVVTSSAFEHDVFFWDTFLELVRILRPGGLLYVNAPSNGDFHRYPLDCWRFYPDAGVALVQWAARRGSAIELIESFIGLPQAERWADFVAVFRKTGGLPLVRKGRIADHVTCMNVHDIDRPSLGNESQDMPDRAIAKAMRADLDTATRDYAALTAQHESLAAQQATLAAQHETALAELAAVHARNDALSTNVAALGEKLGAAERHIDTLQSASAVLNRELLAMRNSTSWRMTSGFRWLTTRLRP